VGFANLFKIAQLEGRAGARGIRVTWSAWHGGIAKLMSWSGRWTSYGRTDQCR